MEKLIKKKAELHNEEIIQEIYRVTRLSKRKIYEALKNNMQANLLKAFWRLAYITYTTVKSGADTGKTFTEFVNPDNVVDGVSKGIKVIQASVPTDSRLAINTNTASGKVKSIGANAALEAVDSLGDPVKIVTKVFDDSIKSTFPSADLTKEDFQILKTEYLNKRKLATEIQESYNVSRKRHIKILELQKEIAELTAEASNWKEKEKIRIKNKLEDSCKKQIKK